MSRASRTAGPPQPCCNPTLVAHFVAGDLIALWLWHHCGRTREMRDIKTWRAGR